MQKKKIETTWCLGWARGHIFASAAQRLRPRALRALPRPPPLRGGGEKCPRAHPRHQVVSIYFIFAFHETTKVLGINLTFFFCGQFHVKLTKKFPDLFFVFWLKRRN